VPQKENRIASFKYVKASKVLQLNYRRPERVRKSFRSIISSQIKKFYN